MHFVQKEISRKGFQIQCKSNVTTRNKQMAALQPMQLKVTKKASGCRVRNVVEGICPSLKKL